MFKKLIFYIYSLHEWLFYILVYPSKFFKQFGWIRYNFIASHNYRYQTYEEHLINSNNLKRRSRFFFSSFYPFDVQNKYYYYYKFKENIGNLDNFFLRTNMDNLSNYKLNNKISSFDRLIYFFNVYLYPVAEARYFFNLYYYLFVFPLYFSIIVCYCLYYLSLEYYITLGFCILFCFHVGIYFFLKLSNLFGVLPNKFNHMIKFNLLLEHCLFISLYLFFYFFFSKISFCILFFIILWGLIYFVTKSFSLIVDQLLVFDILDRMNIFYSSSRYLLSNDFLYESSLLTAISINVLSVNNSILSSVSQNNYNINNFNIKFNFLNTTNNYLNTIFIKKHFSYMNHYDYYVRRQKLFDIEKDFLFFKFFFKFYFVNRFNLFVLWFIKKQNILYFFFNKLFFNFNLKNKKKKIKFYIYLIFFFYSYFFFRDKSDLNNFNFNNSKQQIRKYNKFLFTKLNSVITFNINYLLLTYLMMK